MALSAYRRGYGRHHQAARIVVLARDRYRCHWCGRPATEADHLDAKVPDPTRMVAACKQCNATRGARKGAAMSADPGPSRRW